MYLTYPNFNQDRQRLDLVTSEDMVMANETGHKIWLEVQESKEVASVTPPTTLQFY